MLLLEALALAFQTLTRIPVPSPQRTPIDRTLAWSAVWYPFVGFLLGGAGWLAAKATVSYWPSALAAVIVLVFWAALSGALHEDGLADTADAMGLQRSRDRTLEILKDSRIGAFGVIALILATLLRWLGVGSLTESGLAAGFLASQTLPRAGLVLLARLAGPATDGSGGAVARALRWGHVVAAVALTAALLAPGASERLLVASAVCVAVVLASAVFFRARIGGVTGDCLGAAAMLQEIAVLLVFGAR